MHTYRWSHTCTEVKDLPEGAAREELRPQDILMALPPMTCTQPRFRRCHTLASCSCSACMSQLGMLLSRTTCCASRCQEVTGSPTSLTKAG